MRLSEEPTFATMMMRLLKTVVLKHHDIEFRRLFEEHVEAYFRRRDGNLGFYLLSDLDNPHLYFLLSYWRDAECMDEAFAASDFTAMFMDRARVLHERPRIYECVLVRPEHRNWTPVSAESGLLRLTNASIETGRLTEACEIFDSFTNTFTRQGAGCRAVELAQQRNTENHLFVLSWWESYEDLQRFLQSEEVSDLKFSMGLMAHERIQSWSLRVEIDDPRRPLIRQSISHA